MKNKSSRLHYILSLFFFVIAITSCHRQELSVKDVMDNIVTRFYATMDDAELEQLDDQKIMNLITPEEKQVLATRYWTFDVNVPAVVSVMQHVDQPIAPFWLKEAGFFKTDMFVKNEEYTYQVWQKKFDKGSVALGINGFDKHRPHYFVAVGPQDKNEKLELSGFSPENQYVSIMKESSFTYHDWDELVLTQVPESLKGQILLTTIRGRAREAHLIGAFRTTPYPSSPEPDQIMLTWGDDPQTTVNIQWRTDLSVKNGVVRYWQENTPDIIREKAATPNVLEDRLLRNDRYIHRFTAELDSLQPGQKYFYKVGNPEKDLWSEQAEFITAPSKPSPFSFIYFGDTHRSQQWGRLINTSFTRHPNVGFYTIGGDIVSTGLYRDDWDQLFEYSKDVIKNRPLMPAIGNHDDQDGLGAEMFYELFALPENGPDTVEPEKAFSFTYGNAFFLVLAATSPYKDQVSWIEEQLAKSTAKWKFAIFHFPPYSMEEDYPLIRELWCPVFDKYHVDMVMSGHVHYYMRSKPINNGQVVKSPDKGTIYMISIGIPNRQVDLPDADFIEKRFGGVMLYQYFDINDNVLTCTSYDLDGKVWDRFSIKK